jgi:hypothetical protein
MRKVRMDTAYEQAHRRRVASVKLAFEGYATRASVSVIPVGNTYTVRVEVNHGRAPDFDVAYDVATKLPTLRAALSAAANLQTVSGGPSRVMRDVFHRAGIERKAA